jgi:hypothetical protein
MPLKSVRTIKEHMVKDIGMLFLRLAIVISIQIPVNPLLHGTNRHINPKTYVEGEHIINVPCTSKYQKPLFYNKGRHTSRGGFHKAIQPR